MTNRHGRHIWYELLTTDRDAAAGFYGKVYGWTTASVPGSEPAYTIASAGSEGVAGIMLIPKPSMKPGWLGYVGVDDVDASAAKVTHLGGSVLTPPEDIPGVGRFALVADPQGAPFYVMRGASPHDSLSFRPSPGGHCAWNELATTDQAAALAFYGAMFGWVKSGAMPMGDQGDYTLLSHGGEQIGAMMTRMEGGSDPMWTYYFRVPAIDAAAKRITANAGRIVHGPHEVPDGDYIILATDPQEVSFAVVGKK
jgi:uncharacterized protein